MNASRNAGAAEIRKADGSMLKILVGDSEHRISITTSADTLTAETTIDEVKKAIDWHELETASQTYSHVRFTPPKADIGTQSWNVRFVPKGDFRNDIATVKSLSSPSAKHGTTRSAF
jgi:hypothetical protein